MPPSETLPEQEVLGREELTPLYNVVLLDDDTHTYAYVIEMLEKLFCLSEAAALAHAREVDLTGRTVVITCELAAAEFARDQIRGYGADWRLPTSQGSMAAIIEPAAGR
jgi:ATP-dependent Clp protease adaptor protein ClpS